MSIFFCNNILITLLQESSEREVGMERVQIGNSYIDQPLWKVLIGVPLVYLPIIFSVPFVILCVLLVKTHLKLLGAKNIKPYRDFVPDWLSHRYQYHNQITYSTGAKWHNLRAYRWYWIFNCKLYCPLSVALFRYASYLVKIVENWWCPFEHDKKCEYTDAAIDKSYWHLFQPEEKLLHHDDRNNPVWNQDAEEKS